MSKAKNDQRYLGDLRDYYAENRTIPSYSRLMSLFRLSSKSAVKKVLERLENHGFLGRSPDGDWMPADKFFARAMAEAPVPAGYPLPASDNHDIISIDQLLIEKPSETVMIKVRGDSMVEAGIHSEDLAIIKRSNQAQPGEIVVAIVDDQYTLKKLGHDKHGYHLIPANPEFSIIRPKGKLEIFGVLVGLVRKYQGKAH